MQPREVYKIEFVFFFHFVEIMRPNSIYQYLRDNYHNIVIFGVKGKHICHNLT